MAEYPYLLTPGRIEPFFEKIRIVSTPEKVTQLWLEGIGFKSKADRRLIAVLKSLGFTDANAAPTQRWNLYRGGDKAALGDGIKLAYAGLYGTYPAAHEHSNSDLENVIRTTSPKTSADINSRVLSTYRALVKKAEFSGQSTFQPKDDSAPLGPSNGDEAVFQGVLPGLGSNLAINLNIQLTLPETNDPNVYVQLFKAMREQLLDAGK